MTIKVNDALLELLKVLHNAYRRYGFVLRELGAGNFEGLFYKGRGIGYAVQDKLAVFDGSMHKVNFDFVFKNELVYNGLGFEHFFYEL